MQKVMIDRTEIEEGLHEFTFVSEVILTNALNEGPSLTVRSKKPKKKLKVAEHGTLFEGENFDLKKFESNPRQSFLEAANQADTNGNSLRIAVKAMSKAFRDSQGGSILDRFEEISKILFCKIFDEKHNSSKSFRSIHQSQSYEENYQIISELFELAKTEYPHVFLSGREFLSKDMKAISLVSSILKPYQMLKIQADIKGKIYEELIKNTFEKNENQQFFTPRHIVDFMISLLDPKADQKICDPACGSGGFLIAALQHVAKANPSLDVESYSRENLVGFEIDSRMVWIAKMNLVLHGGDHDSISYLSGGGALSFSPGITAVAPDNSIDIIITNPPFGSDFDQKNELENFVLGRGKKSRRRGVLFVEKCIRMLKPDGVIAIILEEGIFNNPGNEDVRKYIATMTTVEGVISLPDTTFMPYASVKTSILIARKKREPSRLSSKMLMINVESVGFGPNGDPKYRNQRGPDGKLIIDSDLPDVIRAWKKELGSHGNSSRELFFETLPTFAEMCHRLDTLFYHPARAIAASMLESSRYPLLRLSDLVTVVNDTCTPQYDYPDELVRYVGLANISSLDGGYYVSEVLGEKIKSSVKRFAAGNVLYSKLRPELRKVIYILPDDEPGLASSECFVLRARPNILPQFLAMILRSDLVYGQIVYRVTGIGRPRIGRSDLLGVKIPLPPIEVQIALIEKMAIAEQKMRGLLDQSKALAVEASTTFQQGYQEVELSLRA